MILETIVFGGVSGYMIGTILANGVTESEISGMKVIKLDVAKGYKISMKDKKFRFIRDVALVSGTAYVCARGEQKRKEKRIAKAKERQDMYKELCENYDKNIENFIDDRYSDYHSIAEFILEHPDMSKRQLFENMPYTDEFINIETFNEIYTGVKNVKSYNGESGLAIIDMAGDLAEIKTRINVGKQKDILAKELLGGITWQTEQANNMLDSGHKPMIHTWEATKLTKDW